MITIAGIALIIEGIAKDRALLWVAGACLILGGLI